MVSLKDDLRVVVIKAIKNLLQEPARARNYVSLEVRAKAMENSELPQILASFLLLSDESVYTELLELTNIVQNLSKSCCK